MRKGDLLRLSSVAAILALSVTVFGYAAISTTRTANPKQTEPIYEYVIKEYNGNIAVYKSGETRPRDIYEVPVETLPTEDVKNLESGIPVKDEKELKQLIEDLTS